MVFFVRFEKEEVTEFRKELLRAQLFLLSQLKDVKEFKDNIVEKKKNNREMKLMLGELKAQLEIFEQLLPQEALGEESRLEKRKIEKKVKEKELKKEKKTREVLGEKAKKMKEEKRKNKYIEELEKIKERLSQL